MDSYHDTEKADRSERENVSLKFVKLLRPMKAFDRSFEAPVYRCKVLPYAFSELPARSLQIRKRASDGSFVSSVHGNKHYTLFLQLYCN